MLMHLCCYIPSSQYLQSTFQVASEDRSVFVHFLVPSYSLPAFLHLLYDEFFKKKKNGATAFYVIVGSKGITYDGSPINYYSLFSYTIR